MPQRVVPALFCRLDGQKPPVPAPGRFAPPGRMGQILGLGAGAAGFAFRPWRGHPVPACRTPAQTPPEQQGQDEMNFRRWPRTDVGTVLLHWAAVAAVVVLAATGLRFTSDDVQFLWLRDLDGQLATENLWQRHMLAGYVLSVVAVAYAVHMSRARLLDRIRISAVRLQGLFGTPAARWPAINALLAWAFLVAALGACVTGWLAYGGIAGPVLRIHLICTWVILAFPVLHLLALLRVGGVPHLARIFRPKRAEPPPEEIDLAHVVAQLLAEKQAAQRKARRKAQRASKQAGADKTDPLN